MTMLRRCRHRLTATLFVVVSLLFSQLAVASYRCPAAADPAAMARMMAAGVPCAGVDQAQPALCHEHATSAPQSFETVKLPVATSPMVVQVLALPVVLDAAAAVAASYASTPEARPPPDPLFLSTLRLRV